MRLPIKVCVIPSASLRIGSALIFVNTDTKEHGWEEERREKKEIRRELLISHFLFLIPLLIGVSS